MAGREAPAILASPEALGVNVNTRIAACVLSVAAMAYGQCTDPTKLLADDGAAQNLLGGHVEIANGMAIVSARNGGNSNAGAVYLFDLATGAEIAQLVADDGSPDDSFGYSIATNGSILAVGAIGDDAHGPASGAVYLFDLQSFTQITKIVPDDGQARDHFGVAVAMTDSRLVVSASADDGQWTNSGIVYVFDLNTHEQIRTLIPSDGGEYLEFGNPAIAVSDEFALIGCFKDDDNGEWSGSVYVFDMHTGEQIGKLLPDDGAAVDLFGHSVALSGDLAIVGATGDDDRGPESGSAYLFNVAALEQIGKLLSDYGNPGDSFGWSVDLGEGVAVVGAANASVNGNESGAAYVFDLSDGSQLYEVMPGVAGPEDRLGSGVAILGSSILLGAAGDDTQGQDAGAAYIGHACPPCDADLTGDGVVDTLDFLLYLGAWAQGDPLADWDENGTINTLDFLAYLNDWVAGC